MQSQNPEVCLNRMPKFRDASSLPQPVIGEGSWISGKVHALHVEGPISGEMLPVHVDNTELGEPMAD